MCGIAGLFKPNGRFSVNDVEAVLRMLDAQTHRGPDDWGLLIPESTYRDGEVRQVLGNYDHEHIRLYKASESGPAVILGSRRLSILDVSPRGRMPMGNGNGT